MTDTKRLAAIVEKSGLPAEFLALQCNTTAADYKKRHRARKSFLLPILPP